MLLRAERTLTSCTLTRSRHLARFVPWPASTTWEESEAGQLSRVSASEREGSVAIENPALTGQSFARGSAEASATERRGMTAAGTYAKTVVLLVLLAAAAAFGWSQVEIIQVGGRAVAITPWWTWLAFLLTFIFAFAGVFAYRSIPIIAPLYALSEGALLGIASRYYDLQSQGIVAQAVLATLAIFTAVLILYGTGIIKVTPGFAMGVSIAIGGLLLLYLTTW